TRTTTVIHDVAWLRERHDWPGLQSVVMVESVREIGERIERETRFYITSLLLLASVLGPSSSMIRSLYPASCRCRRSNRFSSRASSSSWTRAAAVLKPTDSPFWQAARPPETNVRLAGAAVADRDDVLPAGHILRAGELQHEGLVERWNGGEVETVQALHGREPRFLDPALHHAPFTVDQLEFSQAQQKADMIKALGGALPSELVVLAQERRQLERLQMMSKQKLGRIGHDDAPVSRPMYVLADVIAT